MEKSVNDKRWKPWVIGVAIVLAVVLCNVITGVIVVRVVTNKIQPVPERPIYDIDYNLNQDYLAAIAETYADNVVEIKVAYTKPQYGTGFIVDYDTVGGLSYPVIVTNYHVISESPYQPEHVANPGLISLRFPGSLQYADGITILGYDTYHDIAVLRLERATKEYALKLFVETDAQGNLKYVGKNDDMITAQHVLALGNALNNGVSACDGIISLKELAISFQNGTDYQKVIPVVQITAPINPGNSGGPLFDSRGKLIALNTYQSRSNNMNGDSSVTDNISYSVPADIVVSVYNHIRALDRSSRPNTMKQAQLYSIAYNAGGTALHDTMIGKVYKAGYTNDFFNEIQYIEVTEDLYAGGNSQNVDDNATLADINALKTGDKIIAIGGYSLYTDKDGNAPAAGVNPLEGAFFVNLSYRNIFAELYNYHIDGTGDPLQFTVLRGNSVITATISTYKSI